METFLYLTFGDGTVTIAIKEIKPEPVDGEEKNNLVYIGAAFCSPSDQFVKAEGRKIALERLHTRRDFYVAFERDHSTKLKWQVRDLVKFIILGRWVNKLDVENELEMKISEMVTETTNDFPSDIASMTVHTNTIPTWAKRAAIEKNLY